MDKIQVLYSKLLYSEMSFILPKLKHINYSVVKGEPLSKLIYDSFGMRRSTDIDILIDRRNLKIIRELLAYRGFKTKVLNRESTIISSFYSHQLPPFVKCTTISNLTVDINFDIFWGEYTGKRINIEEFLSDNIEMDIYGVKVQTLSLIKSMVQLILHHYKEMNSIYHLASHNCINYNMFKDVYYLWKNNQSDISLNKLYLICEEYKIIPYAYYVLYYTNQIFNDPDLTVYVDVFKCAEGINLLDYYGLADNERKSWKVDFRTRIETENLYDLIKNELTDSDLEKLDRSRRIFG